MRRGRKKVRQDASTQTSCSELFVRIERLNDALIRDLVNKVDEGTDEAAVHEEVADEEAAAEQAAAEETAADGEADGEAEEEADEEEEPENYRPAPKCVKESLRLLNYNLRSNNAIENQVEQLNNAFRNVDEEVANKEAAMHCEQCDKENRQLLEVEEMRDISGINNLDDISNLSFQSISSEMRSEYGRNPLEINVNEIFHSTNKDEEVVGNGEANIDANIAQDNNAGDNSSDKSDKCSSNQNPKENDQNIPIPFVNKIVSKNVTIHFHFGA